jgi:hypothetical protein
LAPTAAGHSLGAPVFFAALPPVVRPIKVDENKLDAVLNHT